ncbi:5-formyltetrahydrofolate cyclo-ligase [Actinacidiphila acidipaludis]|uniref:5-formyltetrahydrofolate cyclo-ligase n=1 Tax=Actinacidiphila acidipaludis TaxID=2873382 RepID=A0ABS7Q4S3_9ACTN|nr:5-formyltetrahydrofolate cyclo-ligase [Streptomyces acidipaludis]MBY8876764.1 5-formyltetrahydrofolate cyclo-ligase [Streptomyces acidipaludis]
MSGTRGRKAALRADLLRARRGLTADERQAAGVALEMRVRDLPQLARARTVAAYVSMGSEPRTHELIEALRSGGTRVLLPVLLPDNDLDWAEYEGAAALERTGRGLLEPTGERLGPQAVTGAQAVLLPGLAVDSAGVRLGRGGGSYDRVLARLAAAGTRPALVVLLYTNEVVDTVPREPHDHLVDAAITPGGVHHFTR